MWFEHSQERYFVLTGEPGSGKSLVTAWLMGYGPVPDDPEAKAQLERLRAYVTAGHFCVAASGSTSPKVCAENLANQLACQVEGFPDALATSLKDRVQIIGEAHAGEIRPGGFATGVYIGHLDLAALTDEVSFDQALWDPLKKLYASGYDKSMILLIDALDETLTRMGYKEESNLTRLLAKLEDLPEHVRLLLTTRPDPRVLKYYQGAKYFDLIRDAPESADDIRLYTYERLTQLTDEQCGVMAQRIVDAAEGNFLYAHLVLTDLLPLLPTSSNLMALQLPAGLTGLYQSFLNRELGADENKWYEVFRPVLGLIAVAQGEGLTAVQLERITGQEVEPALRICKQYLDGDLPVGPFRPFHRSFTQFLLEDEGNIDYHIDAVRMHHKIVDYYWNTYQSNWLICQERYALQFMPTHLLEAMQQTEQLQEGQLWSELETLLCDLRFVEAKCATGLVYDLEADYDAALSALPEVQQEQQRARAHQQEVAHYTQDLIAYAQAWSEARALHNGNPTNYPMPAPEYIPLPTLAIVRPRTDEELRADTERIIRTPTRLDRLRDFAAFVRAESHHLVQFATQPGFCVQQAYNSVDAGPVVSEAKRLLEAETRTPLLLLHPRQRDAYNPHPALLRTLAEHTDSVTSVSVTPDGQTAVSGSDDGTVRVWDLASGACRHTLVGHSRGVTSVSVTPDGQTAVSGSDDYALRVWDLASGACRHTLSGHTHVIMSVSVTADGRTAVSGSYDHTVRVWDLASGACRHTLSGHSGPVSSISITPDGRTAVSAGGGPMVGEDYTVRVWDLASGECRHILTGPTGKFLWVSVIPDGQAAVSGGDDHTVQVWDLVSGQCLRTFNKGLAAGNHMRFATGNHMSVTRDGCTAVSGSSDDYTLQVWDLTSGALRNELSGHTSWVTSVSVTPDGRTAVSGSSDHTVRVWDLASGQCLRTFEGNDSYVASISMTPDGRTAVSGSHDGTARVWDLASGACRHILETHALNEITSVSVTPDGQTAVSGSDGYALQVWDLTSGALCHELSGDIGGVKSVCVTPDGQTAISTTGDPHNTVQVWDLASGACRHTLLGHTYDVISVSVTPDGRTAVSGSLDDTVRVWDLASGQCLRTLAGFADPVWSVCVTADGRAAVSGGLSGTVRVWDLVSGACRHILSGHTGGVRSVCVTADGRTAVSAGGDPLEGEDDYTVRVWDLASGECRHILSGHCGPINDVRVTPDGRTTVSGSRDGTVRVWDLASGKCLAIFPASGQVSALSEITEGGQLGFGTENGQVFLATLRNVPFAPPRITAARLWLFGEGRWDDKLTTRCIHCGQPFVPPPRVLDAIHNLSAHVAPDQSPCLELPPETWDDSRLLADCPQCRQSLRFNPFVVDQQKTKL